MAKLNDTRVAQDNWTAFWRAYNASGHEAWLTTAQKCDDFYIHGKQWDEALKQELEADGRPALTFNEILRVVNAVRGHYTTARADITFKPKRGAATADQATLLTKLTDSILEANDYASVEEQVFMDGIIEDRGYFDVRISYEENVLGEVQIKALDPREVVIDPDAKEYDPDTWNEVFIDRWMTPNDIEVFYGKEKRQSLEALAAGNDTYGDRSMRFNTFGESTQAYPIDHVDDKELRSIRVIERQYRKLAMVREFVDLVTGETRPVPEHWSEDRVQFASKAFGLALRKRMVRRVRWTVTADKVVLFDDWSPYDHFTVVPYFPMFRRGRPSGIVRHLLDPQEQLNKVESQILHVVNTTANSGWMLEAGSLVNMDEQTLEQCGAETGLVLVYGKNRPKPEKIQPNQIPTGLENYAAKSATYVQNIAGAAGLLGLAPDAEVSGVVLDRAMSKALVGIQVFFDHLDKSRRIVGRRILECIQKFYTEPRVYRVTDWRDPEQPQEEVAINQEVAGEILNNVTLGEFDVVASSAPARDTFEETQFAEALQLREAGVMIPDHHIILASHLAGKRQIAEEVKQLQGLGEPTEAQLMLQELELRRTMAEIGKLEGEIANLQAQAQKAQAQAQTEVAAEQREMFDVVKRYEMEAARLIADLKKKADDLANKLQLAQLHAGAKDALTRYTTLSKGMQQERKLDADFEREALRAAAQQRNQERKPVASADAK